MTTTPTEVPLEDETVSVGGTPADIPSSTTSGKPESPEGKGKERADEPHQDFQAKFELLMNRMLEMEERFANQGVPKRGSPEETPKKPLFGSVAIPLHSMPSGFPFACAIPANPVPTVPMPQVPVAQIHQEAVATPVLPGHQYGLGSMLTDHQQGLESLLKNSTVEKMILSLLSFVEQETDRLDEYGDEKIQCFTLLERFRAIVEMLSLLIPYLPLNAEQIIKLHDTASMFALCIRQSSAWVLKQKA